MFLCLLVSPKAQAQNAQSEGSGNPQSPVASPGGPYVALTGQPIALDASGSWSFDGPIIYYYWNFGDGTSATGPNPTHQYSSEGVYTVALTIYWCYIRFLHRPPDSEELWNTYTNILNSYGYWRFSTHSTAVGQSATSFAGVI